MASLLPSTSSRRRLRGSLLRPLSLRGKAANRKTPSLKTTHRKPPLTSFRRLGSGWRDCRSWRWPFSLERHFGTSRADYTEMLLDTSRSFCMLFLPLRLFARLRYSPTSSPIGELLERSSPPLDWHTRCTHPGK